MMLFLRITQELLKHGVKKGAMWLLAVLLMHMDSGGLTDRTSFASWQESAVDGFTQV
jgi:hypothetical protein